MRLRHFGAPATQNVDLQPIDSASACQKHLEAVSSISGKYAVKTLAETWCKFWGDGVGALAPKFFFTVPQNAKFGGTAGDSLSLGIKCWLSIIM